MPQSHGGNNRPTANEIMVTEDRWEIRERLSQLNCRQCVAVLAFCVSRLIKKGYALSSDRSVPAM